VRSKRFWALASLTVLFLIGGARYGLSIRDGRTFADGWETGLGEVAGIARSGGRWAFRSDSDDLKLKAQQAQRLYQPLVIKQVDPKYPDRARRAGVEGLVIVNYGLDARGRPQDLKVTKSVPMLDEAVLTALRQWEYTPPQMGSTAPIYRYNAQFVLKDLTTISSSSYDPLP
jgi:TonB family protein